MALWKEVQTLSLSELQEVCLSYNDHECPIYVRSHCASWIENEISKNVDPQTFYNGLIKQLQLKAATLQSTEPFYLKMNLICTIERFQLKYSQNPKALLDIITKAINKEYELVQRADKRNYAVKMNPGEACPGQSPSLPNDPICDITDGGIADNIQAAKKGSSDTEAVLKRIVDEVQSANLNYQEHQRYADIIKQHQLNNTQPEAVELNMQEHMKNEINTNLRNIITLKTYFEEHIYSLVQQLHHLKSQIMDGELERWLNAQYMYGIQLNTCSDIDLIQRWCEELVDLIWTTREQLKFAETQRQAFPVMHQQRNGTPNVLKTHLDKVTQMLQELLQQSFIVHSIPSQVLRTATRFPYPHNVTVKLLVGCKLNIYMTPPQVRIELINEKAANTLKQFGTIGKSNGKLINNSGRMEYNRENGDFSAVFKNLKTISREKSCGTATAGGGNEVVTRDKFFLVCTTDVAVSDLNLKLWALSPPIVVTSHGSQDAQAWATITWTNCFGTKDQDMPNSVPWTKVADLLQQFTTRTLGRGLTLENLEFLSQKVPVKDGFVSLQDFTKPLSGSEFSTWEWIFKAVKLIEKEKHLKELWAEGYILGFISKSYGESLLSKSTPGNFLMRISESIIGAITFSWIEKDGMVYSMEPFTSKSLQIQTLSEKVKDLTNFEYLYPNIPKDIVFSKYYEKPMVICSEKGFPEYVKPVLRTMLPIEQFKSVRSNSWCTTESVNSSTLSCGANWDFQPQKTNNVLTVHQSTNIINTVPSPSQTLSPQSIVEDMDEDYWFELLKSQTTSPSGDDGFLLDLVGAEDCQNVPEITQL